MRLLVRYYAVLREITGVSEEEIEVEGCSVKARDLIARVLTRHPEVSDFVSRGMVLVVYGGKLIRDLSEDLDLCSSRSTVDLVPPSSGGGCYSSMIHIGRSIDPESFLRELIEHVDSEVGAAVVYFGIVKGQVGHRKVEELVYEHHEETRRILEKIAHDASVKDGIKYVLIQHSIGSFKPGDIVFSVGILGTGRKNTIETLKEVVERVKHEALIWKIEKRDDGIFWVVGDGERIPKHSASIQQSTKHK
jgi:molybdopterin synthase catalytic subunit/molybdopterin converting factor small subunit